MWTGNGYSVGDDPIDLSQVAASIEVRHRHSIAIDDAAGSKNFAGDPKSVASVQGLVAAHLRLRCNDDHKQASSNDEFAD